MARAPLVRGIRESCGCTSEPGGRRWVAFCRTHRAEFDRLHQQAALDYARRRERRKQ